MNISLLVLCLLISFSVTCFAQSEVSSVEVTARLVDFEEEYPWFEHDENYEEDGVAPLAAFIIEEPEEFEERTVKILFKFGKFTDEDIDESSVGCFYRFRIPNDFFSSEYDIIEDIDVEGFIKLNL